MSGRQREIMNSLYEHDIWDSFVASETTSSAEGWNGNHPSLARLAATAGSNTVIDVGVWKGQSTINMALAMKRAAIDGCVIAVDTFLGSSEHWNAKLFSRFHGMPNLYDIFLSNVAKAGVQDFVVPLPQTSTAAATILSRLNIRANVVHIDAAHEYEDVKRDIEEYWRILEIGGYLIGDDYHETWPGIVRAAGEFSARERLPLSIDPPKWILQRVR